MTKQSPARTQRKAIDTVAGQGVLARGRLPAWRSNGPGVGMAGTEPVRAGDVLLGMRDACVRFAHPVAPVGWQSARAARRLLLSHHPW